MALNAALKMTLLSGLGFMGQRDGCYDLRRTLPRIISLDLLDTLWVLGPVLDDFTLHALRYSFCLLLSCLKYCGTGLFSQAFVFVSVVIYY